MNVARVFWAAGVCIVAGAALGACSGSFGSGSTMPSTMATPNFGTSPTPTPTPSAQSNILTIGTNTEFQPLPEIGGYSGQIAFPTVPADVHTAPPKGSPYPSPSPVSISIGATLSVVKPTDGPDLNLESGTGAHKHTRERPARALAYLELLPTHDVTLASYPRITLDVPREIASQYRDGEFGLALWNSGEKDSTYHLAVAEIDAISTPPPVVKRTALPQPTGTSTAVALIGTPSPTPSYTPGGFPQHAPPGMGGNVPIAGANGGTAGPPGAPATPTVTLPPARILFAGTATPLKLIANRPAIFALYALPHPHATATSSPGAVSSPAPGTAAPASATASASKSP